MAWDIKKQSSEPTTSVPVRRTDKPVTNTPAPTGEADRCAERIGMDNMGWPQIVMVFIMTASVAQNCASYTMKKMKNHQFIGWIIGFCANFFLLWQGGFFA